MSLVRDLFAGLGNQRWDLARVLAFWAVVSYSGTFVAAAVRGQELDFSAIGVGFAAVLAGAAALIFAKDTARTAAVSQNVGEEGT